MHYVLHVKLCEKGVESSEYLGRERNNSIFATKSTNNCDFIVSGLVSTLENVYATFCKYNGVKTVLKCRNILNGIEITDNFRQNRRIIAIL